MNKVNLLSLINEKIQPNGIGEITAETLKDILVEIVNNNTLKLNGQVYEEDDIAELSDEQYEQLYMFFTGEAYSSHDKLVENWESIASAKVIITCNFGDEFACTRIYHVEGEIGNDGESVTIRLVSGTHTILIIDV